MTSLAADAKNIELQAREGKERSVYEHYLERFKMKSERSYPGA